jgi:hypothetical protein
MACPICGKRKPERFCPAKGERICAVCCGTEREVTIDCPFDCVHLMAARRYEAEHRKPLLPDEIPFAEAHFSSDLIQDRRPAVSALALAILKLWAAHPSVSDRDVFQAVTALAETYRTLGSGIYYEKPPDGPLPRTLYSQLAKSIQEYRQQDVERAGLSGLKDQEIFYLLVFLLRVARQQINGRPRSRVFLEFLRRQFPQAAPEGEAPRIIVP